MIVEKQTVPVTRKFAVSLGEDDFKALVREMQVLSDRFDGRASASVPSIWTLLQQLGVTL